MKTEYVKKLWFRYKQFGGWRLVREYMKMGLAGYTVRMIVKCAKSGQPFKKVYPYITLRVDEILRKRYEGLMMELLKKDWGEESVGEERNTVWFSWLQGLENAPELVKACYNSQRRYLKDKKFVIITADNYKDFISLPEHIERKWKEGIIPSAMASDIIRLELLIKYGGTWIDSTVLCTGNDFDEKILENSLFFPQYYRKDNDKIAGISNWFISANANNKMLNVLKEMLCQYWRDYDCVVEYFFFHRFFMMIANTLPEEMEKMPRYGSVPCLQLEMRSSDDFDERWYGKITSMVCFHKLNYRVNSRAIENKNSYYNKLLSLYREEQG